MKRIKVLIVDDSAIVRKLLTEAIAQEEDLEVVATAPDPFVARDKILQLKPDVITLDIEMPRMDGLTFLKALMKHHPLPTIVISSLCQSSAQQTLDAFRLGAVEVLAKPGSSYSVGELQTQLPMKIRAAAAAKIPVSTVTAPALHKTDAKRPSELMAMRLNTSSVIAIGASTGGTEAIREILTRLPTQIPPIVITQHIPAMFSRAFAERLDSLCPFEVKEAADGDFLKPGRVLIAPGNFHMVIRKSADRLRVEIKDGPPVCYSRPSVDVMFSSLAEANGGQNTIAILLTGMGADGAQGILKLKRMGANTIAQDEASCVVFGMPKEAIRLGAINHVLPLHQIADALASAPCTLSA